MFRPLIAGLLATFLSACAAISVKPPVTDESHALWQQRLEELDSLVNWSIRGRIAVYVKDEVYNLGLGWTRQGEQSRLKLEATLGQGMILLEKKPASVKLTTAENVVYSGSNAQQILYQATGLVIPVEGLQTWIKALPHPSTSYLPDIDALGRANQIRQDGWIINYLEYSQTGLPLAGDHALPRRLYMKHDKLALKIVIDQWQNQSIEPSPELFPVFPD